jgi:hypothetical protein
MFRRQPDKCAAGVSKSLGANLLISTDKRKQRAEEKAPVQQSVSADQRRGRQSEPNNSAIRHLRSPISSFKQVRPRIFQVDRQTYTRVIFST